MTKSIFLYAVAFCINLIFLGCHSSPNQTMTVKLGAILPLSGDGASYGKSMQNGIELYLTQRSKETSPQISVIYEDTQLDQVQAVSGFRKLISINEVPAVMGPFSSSQMLAVAPVAEQQERVLISGTATSPAITDAGDFIFRIIPSDTHDGRVVANLIKQQLPNTTTVSIVHVNNDFGIGIRDAFKNEAMGLGLKIILEIAYPQENRDFRVQIQKIIKKAPDAVFLVGYKEMGLFLRQSEQAGLKCKIVATGLMEDPEIIKVAGKAADGVLYSYPAFRVDSKNELVASFVDAYKQKYGSEPDAIAALGFDLAHLLADVLEAGKPYNAQTIKNRLYKVKDFPGVAGNINFDINGDVEKSSGVKIVKDGEFHWVTETLNLSRR